MTKEKDRGPWFMTHSGIHFYLFDPRPEEIRIEDIIMHLSVITRFGGALGKPYSVAQHSLTVSDLVPRSMALEGLMHDAAEAYIGDVVRPFKQSLSAVREVEDHIMDIISKKYSLVNPLPEEAKDFDKRVTIEEGKYFGMAVDEWEDPVYKDLFLTNSEKEIMMNYMGLTTLEIQEIFRNTFFDYFNERRKV